MVREPDEGAYPSLAQARLLMLVNPLGANHIQHGLHGLLEVQV